MTLNLRLTLSTLFVLLLSISAAAQTTADATAPVENHETESVVPDSSTSSPYTLKRGDNELGFWAGFSPVASTVFGGLSDAEADNRKFFLASFRYGRTLVANDSVALQYTLDAIPVALRAELLFLELQSQVLLRFVVKRLMAGGVTPLACNSISPTVQKCIRLFMLMAGSWLQQVDAN